MRKFLFSIIFILFLLPSVSFAIKRTWVAPVGGLWSDANNWLPVGVPGASDTAVFNSPVPCNLDMDVTIAALWAIGFGGNITSSGPRIMTIDNSGNTLPVLYVAAGASLSMGNGAGIAFSTYGPSGANNAQVAGSLVLKSASAWAVNNIGAAQITETDISGTLNVDPTHTGVVLENSTAATVRFLVSSTLFWRRDGGIIPAADYQDGSTINVTGITNTMLVFSTATNYNGLVIWNSAAQDATVTGATAQLLPTETYPMDSIRVMNTGAGTLRLTTDPSGFSLGHLEVRDGTLEMSAANPPSVKTATISTDLVITGGTVFLNATYATDVPGNAGSMRLTVNGDILISGGTLNLTNRPEPGTYGAGQIDIAGDIIQTGGTITASSIFGAQNYFKMLGGAVQNLQMNNITGQVNLVITNNTGGINLLNNVLLPRALTLTGGFIALNNFNLSVPYPLLSATVNGKIVTNGTGALTVRSLTLPGGILFPVAISSTTYNPVVLGTIGAAVTNDYTISVEAGINPGGVYHPSQTINRTWHISSASNIISGSVTLGFQYRAAEANAFCNPADNMELGHFIPASNTWNLDPGGSVVPATPGPGIYTAGTFAPASLVGSFVLGNIGSILAVQTFIDITAKKRNSSADISWLISTDKRDIKQVAIERSANGINFAAIATFLAGTNVYTDDKLLPGHNYYRVKITDINGKITYSALAVVLNKESGFDIIGLAPTVINNNAVLNVTAAQKLKMDMVITDVAGRQVQKNTYHLIAGSNRFNLSFAQLTAGTYQITGYTIDGVSKTLRFVKQ